MEIQQRIKSFIKGITSPRSGEVIRDIVNNDLFLKKLEDIWDATPSENAIAKQNRDRIWGNIHKTIHRSNNRNLKLFSYAASIAVIILSFSTAYLLLNQKNTIWNIQKVGHQTTDMAILPDGTRVVLGADSKISYPSEFTSSERVVELTGQAFFYVEKNENQPFIVKTKKIDISVLGTEFEVFSYEEDDIAEVTLVSGKVKVLNNDSYNNAVTLSPDQRISITENNTIEIDSINADEYTIWRDKGTLSFYNEKLGNIVPRLEKWYGRKIKISDNKASNTRFTFTVHDETLIELMDMLVYSSTLKYKKEHEEYIIRSIMN